MSNSKIDSELCGRIVEVLKQLPNLVSLDIRMNYLGPAGAAHITKLQQTLEELNIKQNAISNEGASTILFVLWYQFR